MQLLITLLVWLTLSGLIYGKSVQNRFEEYHWVHFGLQNSTNKRKYQKYWTSVQILFKQMFCSNRRPEKKSSQYDEIMVLAYAFLCLNYTSVIINNKSKWKDPTNIKFEFNLNLLFFISPTSIWRVPLGRSRPPEVKQIRNYYNMKKIKM